MALLNWDPNRFIEGNNRDIANWHYLSRLMAFNIQVYNTLSRGQ